MMPRNLFIFAAIVLMVPVLAGAAALVNINTADLTTLETLNGIGPSKGQAIIDYRTQHGPFAVIADIQNVSGIGPATYANIKDYITVSDAAPAQPQSQTQSQSTSTNTQTQTAVSLGGNGPPPITAQITAETPALVGAGTSFAGAAFNEKGEPLSGARYIWNFGDGNTGEGSTVVHTYEYPGDYQVMLSVGYNYSSAMARLAVPAVAASVGLVAEGDGSLTIINNADVELDVGSWSLTQGTTSSFYIPEHTFVARGKGVRFSSQVLRFVGDRGAVLRYQNGTVAATAAVGAHSPLRGEPVSVVSAVSTSAVAPTVKPSPQSAAIQAVNQTAAVAASPAREVGWSYLVGLAAVIALGVVGTYYAYTKPSLAVTELPEDEFDIE